MSLLVYAFQLDERQQMRELPGQEPSRQLGGFEADRQNIYGSEIAISLGLTLLPTLRTTDVFAMGEDLKRLESELDILAANIDLFGEASEHVDRKLKNIRHALALAQAVEDEGGGIYLG